MRPRCFAIGTNMVQFGMTIKPSDQREPFRWRNCYADVAASQHERTVANYVSDVIKPAVAALDVRIEEYAASKEPVALFYKSDVEDVRRETLIAFALALQSIWERQVRQYLAACARELAVAPLTEEIVAKANWKDLRAHFRTLRDIRLESFPSFEELNILHLLGNTCRHGDGPSAVELWQRRPALWPPRVEYPFDFGPVETGPQKAGSIELKVGDLEGFATAIIGFWDDAEYIYEESIVRKHDGLESKLGRDRAARSWLPKAEA